MHDVEYHNGLDRATMENLLSMQAEILRWEEKVRLWKLDFCHFEKALKQYAPKLIITGERNALRCLNDLIDQFKNRLQQRICNQLAAHNRSLCSITHHAICVKIWSNAKITHQVLAEEMTCYGAEYCGFKDIFLQFLSQIKQLDIN